MARRRPAFTVVTLGAIATIVAFASPARASTNPRLDVLAAFTQTDVSSYDSWLAARNDQAAWADDDFVWTTDYCTYSPNRPLGFDFRLPCARHDFGYANYQAVSYDVFLANRDRLDSAFYADMVRKCATYSRYLRPACNAVAETYYEAVRAYGTLPPSVTTPGVRQAAQLLPASERASRLATSGSAGNQP